MYTAPDGKRYRPSMFITLTCDSYGKVNNDGTPADPASYDYTRAARDAIHFAALFDRFIQNLRRVLGYEAQYFGGVEPQKRLAPHIHLAVRAPGFQPLATHVFDRESRYLDSDAVFAVKPSLIRTFEPRAPDDPNAPDGTDGPWYALDDLNLVLVPA